MCSGEDRSFYYGHTNNMAVVRGVFDRFGPFDQRMRGSDTIFVQRVVNGLSASVVRYCPDVVVLHQELSGIRAVFRKLYTYGHSSHSYRKVVPAQTLTFKHRWRVFRRVLRECRPNPLQAFGLFCMLACGLVAWSIGNFRATVDEFYRELVQNSSSA